MATSPNQTPQDLTTPSPCVPTHGADFFVRRRFLRRISSSGFLRQTGLGFLRQTGLGL